MTTRPTRLSAPSMAGPRALRHGRAERHGPRPRPRAGSAAAPAGANALTRWSLYAFAFSLPFEVGERSLPVDVPTITGTLFLLACALQPRVAFARIPAALWLFAAYLWVFALAVLVGSGDHLAAAVKLGLQILQPVLIFWVAANLFADARLVRGALLALVLGCSGRALLPFLGLATISPESTTRVSALGQNPNRSAIIQTVGLLAMVGLLRAGLAGGRAGRLLGWGAAGLLGLSVLMTGSRTGFLAMAAGLLAFVLARGTLWQRARGLLFGALVAASLVGSVLASETLRVRFESTFETGEMAGREQLYPALLEMLRERPLLGWGPQANEYELQRRLALPGRDRKSAHNTALEVLSATGTAGALFMFLAVAVCAAGAWRGRRGPFGALPLALLTAVLLAGMGGNLIAAKVAWFAFALAAADAGPRAAPAPARVRR